MLQDIFLSLKANDYVRAETLLSKLLSVQPTNTIALELMGVVCGMQKRPLDALEFFQKCLVISPENGSLYFNIAKALTDLKRDHEAIEYHIKAKR